MMIWSGKQIGHSLQSVLILFVLWSCDTGWSPEHGLTEQVRLSACFEDTSPISRTCLSDSTRILWSAGDRICLYTQTGNRYEFSSDNEKPSPTVVFEGSVSADDISDIQDGYAVYPSEKCSALISRGRLSSLIISVDSLQYARPGSFAEKSMPSIAQVSGNELCFKNLCSGLAFRLDTPGIESVTLSSASGECLTGSSNVVLMNSGEPYIVRNKYVYRKVTVRDSSSRALQAGVWYYMSFFPVELTNGVVLTFRKGNSFARKVVSVPMTFKRNVFGRVDHIDSGVQFEKDPYLAVSQTSPVFSVSGGSSMISVMATSQPSVNCPSWISCQLVSSDEKSSGILQYTYSITVSENSDSSVRKGTVSFALSGTAGAGVSVVQRSGYQSTDYSRDGNSVVLQNATEGNGVDIIIMGDAFSDRQIADGTYDSYMKQVMEAIFASEPMKSLRKYFNVRYVEVVSESEGLGQYNSYALETSFGYGAILHGDYRTVSKYAIKSGILTKNASIAIIFNSDTYVGSSVLNPGDEADWGTGVGVSRFTFSSSSDKFQNLVQHELVGHAYAKLGDEYYSEGLTLTAESAQTLMSDAESYGWYQNIEFFNEPVDSVKWAAFLNDSRYAGENLGIYEGALTREFGSYRPSLNSKMKDNSYPFNAPSRHAIWYRTMTLAFGDDWKYDYEDFVKFDMSCGFIPQEQ